MIDVKDNDEKVVAGFQKASEVLSDDTKVKEAQKAAVKEWTKRIKEAKKKFEKDYQRIKDDIDFAFGLQWAGQMNLHDEDRYCANITLRNINQKVSSLYARDPKVKIERRKRMYYSVWDEKIETLQQSLQNAMMGAQQGIQPPAAWSVLLDYEQGERLKEMIDKVAKTLEIVYQWNIDEQQPDFKTQMEQLVRRVITCGVAYTRVDFHRANYPSLTSVEQNDKPQDRAKKARLLLEKIERGEIQEDSAEIEQLRVLANSFQADVQETQNVEERLVFDFPSSTSIIVDPRCRALRGFVNAQWVAQEMILPIDEINAFFETNISSQKTELAKYKEDGTPEDAQALSETKQKTLACLWCVYHKTTKSHFYIVDGHDKYIQEPQPLEPEVNGFWPIFALTFNDAEVEPGRKASIYPPSDVTLMRPAQKEHNRIRQALREHRMANTPKYMTGAGWLTADDKENIEMAKPNAVIEIKGARPDADINQLIKAFTHSPINPSLYDTKPNEMDILFTTGAQQANLGPAQPNVTATVGTIAEQSRLSVATSNVDALDSLLTNLAKAGGEMLLREMSQEVVKRIVGPGAVWPMTNREDFLNEIYLITEAASSGRPNKAIEIANMERLGPLMLQFGANPQSVLREIIKRLDERLEPKDFFPVVPQGMLPQQPPPQGQAVPSPQQPLPQIASGASVPLAAA